MSYEELDKWVGINAPNLNKEMLHTLVESIVSSETPVSDFTTATVTVNVDDTIIEEAIGEAGVANIPVGIVISEGEYPRMWYDYGLISSVLTIPLYKGKASILAMKEYTITTSGSITYSENGMEFVITGDGTINVEPKNETEVDDPDAPQP